MIPWHPLQVSYCCLPLVYRNAASLPQCPTSANTLSWEDLVEGYILKDVEGYILTDFYIACSYCGCNNSDVSGAERPNFPKMQALTGQKTVGFWSSSKVEAIWKASYTFVAWNSILNFLFTTLRMLRCWLNFDLNIQQFGDESELDDVGNLCRDK